MDFTVLRHTYMYNSLPFILQNLRLKIHCRGKQIWIRHTTDEVSCHINSGFRRHAIDNTIIIHTKEEIAAETIQKRTDAFISISFNAITATFEFNGNVLVQSEQLFNSLRSHIRSSQSI